MTAQPLTAGPELSPQDAPLRNQMVLITTERAKHQPCLLSSSQTFILTCDPQPCPCPALGLGAVWVSLALLLMSLLVNSPLLSVPKPMLPGLQGTKRAHPVFPPDPHPSGADLSCPLDLCVRWPQGPCPVRSQGRETRICSQARHAAEKKASGTPTPYSRLAPLTCPARCPPRLPARQTPVALSCHFILSSVCFLPRPPGPPSSPMGGTGFTLPGIADCGP